MMIFMIKDAFHTFILPITQITLKIWQEPMNSANAKSDI